MATKKQKSEEPKQPVKPQLHVSHMSSMYKCEIQFQRVYGVLFGVWHEAERRKPGIALARGISVHKSIEKNLLSKLQNGVPISVEEAEATARDEFNVQLNEGLQLTEKEIMDTRKTIGDAVDSVVALTRLHHHSVAPKITPAAVEDKFVIKVDNYPYDIAGKKDVRDIAGQLWDHKTTAPAFVPDIAQTVQMSMYGLSEKLERKIYPVTVNIDCLVVLKTPRVEIVSGEVKTIHMERAMERAKNAMERIQSVKEGKAKFTPADPTSWVCTAERCGFARSCKFWSGR